MNNRRQSLWGIPVFWLVIGLPLLSIVAGVGLVVIAIRAGGADVVSDPVQRKSQIQTTDLSPHQVAKDMGLSALLRVHDGVIEVRPVTGKFPKGTVLRLALEHPIQQSEDLHVDLQAQGDVWRTTAGVDDAHDWRVQLEDADGRWRLQGRLPKQQYAARLAPSLDAGH